MNRAYMRLKMRIQQPRHVEGTLGASLDEFKAAVDTELTTLRARVEELEVAADTLRREKQLVDERLETAMEGLREIVVGKTQSDFAAGQERVGEVCAGRLCRIARTTLTAIGGDNA